MANADLRSTAAIVAAKVQAMREAAMFVAFSTALFAAFEAIACATHGTTAGSGTLVWTGETADSRLGEITIADNLLVPPDKPTTCVCGIGLGTTVNPLPGAVAVTGVAIVIADASRGTSEVFRAFSFAPNANMTAGLRRTADRVSSSGSGPLFAGSAWFGFAASVAPFELPRLGPGQTIQFRYQVRVPKSALPFGVDVQFAAGEGLADGSPDFTGAHPVRYFMARSASIEFRDPAERAPASGAPRRPARAER
jgi:hypothetical protein